MAITRNTLQQWLDQLLQPDRFADYGPNGLQIEGAETIQRIAFAVSATADSVTRAVEAGAQALIVHHGVFWKFHGARPLIGPFARRVCPLVRHEINLFAYHLPLDAHGEVGNAASLGRLIGLAEQQPFGDYQGCPTGVRGRLTKATSAGELRLTLQTVLHHEVLMASPDPRAAVVDIGIITGGANKDWPLAVRENLDAFITGEMSEHDWHESQEAGIHMFAGGHHATEVWGIRALMARLEGALPVECLFIPSDNPA